MNKWPKSPYVGLSFYGPEDLPLFAGRDDDIRNCGTLLASYGTRTLVIHGLTGCGKSSFLRAGLIPLMEQQGVGFNFLKDEGQNYQAIFIRCTHSPLSQISDYLYHFAQTDFTYRSPDGLEKVNLKSVLSGARSEQEFREICQGKDGLLDVMLKLSERLPTTLVLVLDQAEEVITLFSHEREEQRRDKRNFFDFLNDFNGSTVDIKLIIALRTEYYGRFFYEMQYGYTTQSDVKQYLLEDLTLQNLMAAIERPTLKKEVGVFSIPYEQYQFEYQGNLTKKIAGDLFKAKQRGGVLPLMQIVCRSLYEKAKENRGLPLTLKEQDYIDLGGVEGRIEAHITNAIEKSLRGQVSQSDMEMEIQKWRRTLCSLADNQEDGSVTTRVLPPETIKEKAKAEDISVDFSRVLEILVSPDLLILRKVPMLNEATGEKMEWFSLGHDTLGLSLLQWRIKDNEAKARKLAERRAKIMRLSALVGGAFAFIGIFGGIFEYYARSSEQKLAITQKANRLVSAARIEAPRNYSLGLLLAIEALRIQQAATIELEISPKNQLSTILARTPKKVEIPELPYGFSKRTVTENSILLCCTLEESFLHVDLKTGKSQSKTSTNPDIYRPWFGINGSKIFF